MAQVFVVLENNVQYPYTLGPADIAEAIGQSSSIAPGGLSASGSVSASDGDLSLNDGAWNNVVQVASDVTSITMPSSDPTNAMIMFYPDMSNNQDLTSTWTLNAYEGQYFYSPYTGSDDGATTSIEIPHNESVTILSVGGGQMNLTGGSYVISQGQTISNLTAQQESNTTNISTLSSGVETLNTGITSLSSQVGTNTTGITSLSSQVGENSTNITSLSSQTTNNTSNISTLSSSVSNITSNLSNANNQISTNSSDISSLFNDYSTLNTNVNSVSSQVAEVIAGNTGQVLFSVGTPGILQPNEYLAGYKAIATTTFPVDLSGSIMSSLVAATDSQTINFVKVPSGSTSGTVVGSAIFAASGTTATFSTSGNAITLDAGDNLLAQVTSTADATLATIVGTIVGSL